MRRPYNGTYSITRAFGVYDPAYANYPGSKHPGTDYALPENTPLFATIKGTVTAIKRGLSNIGRGNEVIITVGNVQVKYCHLNRIDVNTGDTVEIGQQVGLSGWTGYVVPKSPAGAHLHFEVLIDGVYTDPELSFKQGTGMDKDDKRQLFITGVHREPQTDNDYMSLPDDAGQAAIVIREGQEWLEQNHILKVAYPNALRDIEVRDQKIAELEAELANGAVYEQATVYVKKVK